MQHVLTVSERDGVSDLGHKLGCGLPIERTVTIDAVLQRTFHQRHQEIRLLAVGEPRVEHRHDAVVSHESLQRLLLSVETNSFLLRVGTGSQELHRYGFARINLLCRPDVGRPTRAEMYGRSKPVDTEIDGLGLLVFLQ